MKKLILKINHEYWDVQFVHPNHPCLRLPDGSYTIGACNDKFKTIFINRKLNEFYTKKVLIHEICHAIVFSYNLDIPYNIEEQLSDLIATYGQEIINLTNSITEQIKNREAQ